MQHLDARNRPALAEICAALATVEWRRETISSTLKGVAGRHGLKLPQVMMPLRVLVAGSTSTPAIDAVLAAMSRQDVLERLGAALERR